jgi:tetratricopeptide (TPR) repeat protein/predicted Ser/Thr protein kinase
LPLADVTLAPTAMGTAVSGTQAWSVAVTPRPSSEAAAKGQLEPGFLLAERFEILQLLGQGGMGAVYKARDTELERLVALKLIRPELASHPEILRRFKQELILAREVTHRNVIRIFDLGQAQGIKFITMEYVEGRDLKGLIHEKGKLTTDEAVPIVLQIAAALEAAHTAGVVHRDLKPQNVMTDKDGRVYVMDFGIARSLEHQGMTQTGALMGTPEYMSPEQAKGEKVDARSDLFALGIIFYEMLTGISPFKADTAMAMMFKRTQERATPLSQLNLGVPPVISDIVSKCLEIKTDERYQSAREVINDLEAWKGGVPHSTIVPTSRRIRYAPSYQKWLVVGGAVVFLGLGAYLVRDKLSLHSSSGTAAVVQPISLAILPFHNATTDLALDWLGPSLADMLTTDVGQSAHLRTVSSDRLYQVLKDLRVPANAEFDPDTVHQLAKFSSADILVWGRYSKSGDQIRIDATLEDLKQNRRVPLKIEAASEKEIRGTVDQLAELIRKNLAVSSEVLKELKAAAFTPTSSSEAALKDFTQGLELARQGNHIEAVKQFEAATKADSNFALAFSMLAKTYARLGYDRQAQQSASRSVELSGSLSPVEKYMIQAANARIGNNYQNALDAYNNLLGLMPNDAQVQFELGELFEQHGVYDQAHEHYAKALESDPKHIDALRGIGQVEYERGNPQGSLDHLNRALSLAVELNNRQGKAIVLQNLGEAYKLLNRPQDALQNFQQSLDIKQQIGDKKGMATSLDQIALVYGLLGKSADAEKTYRQELNLRKELGDQEGLGVALLDFGAFLQDNGRFEEALANTKQALQIQMQFGNQPRQAMCLTNIGWIYFQLTKYDDAQMYQQRAVDLLQKLNMPTELATNLNNLALSYAMIGQFDSALNSYLQALEQARKVGAKEQISAISDGMAELFLIQGRYGAALKAQQEAVKNAQQLEQQSGTFLAESQADYANVLNRLGRGSEGQKTLDESFNAARSAQNDALAAKILNFQGQRFYYQGDFKSARPFFERAQQSASKAKDRIQTLTARLYLARVSVNEGHAATAVSALRGLIREADSLGVKYLATSCSIALGEALLASKDYAHAQDELESAVRKSEDLGMKSLLPEAHYLLSQALRKKGNVSDADRHLQQAAQYVEQMRQESQTDALLERADFKPIVKEAGK